MKPSKLQVVTEGSQYFRDKVTKKYVQRLTDKRFLHCKDLKKSEMTLFIPITHLVTSIQVLACWKISEKNTIPVIHEVLL